MIMRFTILLILVLGCVSCDRILIGVGHFSSVSHKKSILPLAEALGQQGHDVHFWNIDYVFKPVKSDYFKDSALVLESDERWVLDAVKYENSSTSLKYYWASDKTTGLDFNVPWRISTAACKTAMRLHFDELIRLANDRWDFMLFESFFAPCSWIIHKLAPSETKVISISSSGFMPYTSAGRALGKHIIANPELFTPMSFDARRFYDRLVCLYDYLDFHVFHVTTNYLQIAWHLDEHYRDFSVYEQEKTARFAFTTYPQLLDGTTPKNRDASSFGGGAGSCEQSDGILEEEYRTFVEDPSSKGTIVAAFGHHTSWQYAPPKFIEAFVYSFGLLTDYRIIWQYIGGPEIPKFPHVKIVSWFPQKELLAHPKTKVFISHMGLKSSIEAVCAGVPVLACPLFAEQQRNSANLASRGMSIAVDKKVVQPKEFNDALTSLLADEKYMANARKWSIYLREGNMMSPAQESAFWVKFVGRDLKILNKFMYNKGRSLGYVSYFCIDVVIFLLTLLVSIFYLFGKLSLLFICN